jgi:hypothetical protein
MAHGCEEELSRARLFVCGPVYLGDCDAYQSCDAYSVRFTTARGLDAELISATFSLQVGLAAAPDHEPSWSHPILAEIADGAAWSGGVVNLAGASGYCTVRVWNVFIIAEVDSVWFQIEAPLDETVGPFACDWNPDVRHWIFVEVTPLHWFDDLTHEMLVAIGESYYLEPGHPVTDAVLSRILDSASYRFMTPPP